MQEKLQFPERPTSFPQAGLATAWVFAALCIAVAVSAVNAQDARGDDKVTGAFVCDADETTLCLNQGRFQVKASWRDHSGQTGVATVVPFGSDDSGLYWFFVDDNWEMLVKVLDGCGLNDRFWVFATATTDVEYSLEVVDSSNGTRKTYFNELGNASPAITDTSAFATCP